MALNGHTEIVSDVEDTLSFIDVNFDGYNDICLFDTYTSARSIQTIYLIWNPDKAIFEYDAQLSCLNAPLFDQEEKLIYDTTRTSASNVRHLTYQFVNREFELVSESGIKTINLKENQIKKFLEMVSAYVPDENLECIYEFKSELNRETGEMVVLKEDFAFYYTNSVAYSGTDAVARICADSEVGKLITARK